MFGGSMKWFVAAAIVFIIIIAMAYLGRGHVAKWTGGAETATSGKATSGKVVTLHYTNWCGACTRMKPVWAAVKAKGGATFLEVNEEDSPTEGVNSYPTIYREVGGQKTQYMGGPDPVALQSFIHG